MAKPVRKTSSTRSAKNGDGNYEALVSELFELLSESRRTAARAVNSVMTRAYWLVGQRIVEHEQQGKRRAGYGEELLAKLADDLTSRLGRGFSERNLRQMRAFYLAWPIRQTLSAELGSDSVDAGSRKIWQTASAKSELAALPLPWSHYVRLLSVENATARAFYETEALRGGWTVRQLERQIDTQFYERTALSKNKRKLLTEGAKALPEDATTPDEEIKSPYVLEFLALRDEYSESDLEAALIGKLEELLLELGGDFAFVGRQRRLRIDDEWYRVDLLFFHRTLRCLVVIDLKLGKLTHADAGQMHLYLNYAREHWMTPGENPPVGLILCATKGAAVAKYALEGLPNKVLAAEYHPKLPTEERLASEIARTRKWLESRSGTRRYGGSG
jgi:predicted nuclease of restriction endonuclease-like (RecB) superfamily